jgi:two-component system, LytTR family, response regulator LytT
MRILIFEDEAPAQRRMQKLVKECEPSAEIVGIIPSVAEGFKWFQNNSLPDLIFSDIQLADDLSFKLFQDLKLNVPVIFTTAYDEYAINAFKFYSIDYLLKPIDAAAMRQSIEKYKSIHQQANPAPYEELLKKILEKTYRERFLVYSKDKLIPIYIKDVAYFESTDGTTSLVTFNNERYYINESLDLLEEEVDPKKFFRINRQVLASAASIVSIFNYGLQKLKVSLKPGTSKEFIISKLKATAFKSWLNR